MEQCQNTVIATVASSLTVFILSSALFLLIGCVCGWFIHNYQNKRPDKNINSRAAPIDIQPSTSLAEDQEKAFALEENIAYVPVQSV